MKRAVILALSAIILCTAAGCSQGTPNTENTESSVISQQISSTDTSVKTDDEKDYQAETEAFLKEKNFKGVVYAEKGGKAAAVFADAELENGDTVTIDMPMPVGSVSKQFCAAAILLLQEQGKLSIDDTLDKYYPEYSQAGRITLQNLLCMRSGIPDITEDIYSVVSVDNTEEENTAKVKEYFFPQPLMFEPGTAYAYSNTNFFLLGNIVEQVSGMKYIDFLRENIFTPLGMIHTGSIDEMLSGADWANGVIYTKIDLQPGITKGAGDLLSNGTDIALWLKGLGSGKIISQESFEAMTTDYNDGEGYGYGIRSEFFGGIGHPGGIGKFVSADVIDSEDDIIVFLDSDQISVGELNGILSGVLNCLR